MVLFSRSVLAACILATAASAQTIVNTIPYSGPFAGGIGHDPVTDEVVVVDSTSDMVSFLDRTTGNVNSSFTSPSTLAVGCHVDVATGNIWIGDESETVYECTRSGGVVQSWSCSPTITDLSALTLDPATGNIWISNDSANIVAEFTSAGVPTGIQFSPQGSTDGDGITYDPYNRVFYMGEDTSNSIIVVDVTGTAINTVSVASLGISPEGLALDTVTGTLLIGNGFVSPIAVYEVAGIMTAPPATAVVHYGMDCGSARLDVSDATRDDGLTPAGFSVGFQSGQTPGATALIIIGVTQQNLPLRFLGSTCRLYALPDIISVAGPTNANGRLGLSIPIPPGAMGAGVTFWGVDVDLTSTNIVPSSSDGVQMTVQ